MLYKHKISPMKLWLSETCKSKNYFTNGKSKTPKCNMIVISKENRHINELLDRDILFTLVPFVLNLILSILNLL